jgi:hypothetical protein
MDGPDLAVVLGQPRLITPGTMILPSITMARTQYAVKEKLLKPGP